MVEFQEKRFDAMGDFNALNWFGSRRLQIVMGRDSS